ncbi:FecR family protein [Sphingomonas sp. RS6]
MTSADLHAMDEAAALWVQRMAMPVQDSETAAAFDRWILENPNHVERYARMAQLWQADGLTRALREVVEPSARSHPLARWRGLGGTGRHAARLIPALAAVILLLVAVPAMLRAPIRYAAPRDAMREVKLADHSHVQLAPGAQIAVRLTPWSREVTLERGQAFFDVAHERLRNFAVDAGDTRVRVLGTAFDVDRLDGEQVIRVYRGTVSVAAGAGREWRLPAGSGLAVRGSNARTLDEVTGTRPDWAEGWFDASNTPVRQLVAHLNRTSPVPIRLAEPVLGDLQVTGRFRLDAPEEALRAVAAIHDLHLERDPNGYLLSR